MGKHKNIVSELNYSAEILREIAFPTSNIKQCCDRQYEIFVRILKRL